MEKVLVTGAAGFIGSNVCKRLLKEQYYVIGIDNFRDNYDVKLKKSRIVIKDDNFKFIKCDITNKKELNKFFNEYKPDIVVNLAACAGVRNSILNPSIYIDVNVVGFHNVLELSKDYGVKHVVYASSSSVYGDSMDVPYEEDTNTSMPISLYAATKKCDEVIAFSYSEMFGLPTTGLRFFTVYGPAGRPDMAYFSFTEKLVNNKKIELFNSGNLRRDFTYIDDIVEGIYRVVKSIPKEKYNIYNIGRGEPIVMIDFIIKLHKKLVKYDLVSTDLGSHLILSPMQDGDVYETYCDTSKFKEDFDFIPNVSIDKGLDRFVKWYKDYYKK